MRYLPPIVQIRHILRGHSVLNFLIIQFGQFFDGQFFYFVKTLQNLGIRAAAKRAKESRRQKFAPPLLAIQINPKHVVGVKLCLIPRPAIRDDSEGVKHFPIGMLGCLKR